MVSKYFEISTSTQRSPCSMNPLRKACRAIMSRSSRSEAVRAQQEVRLIDRLQQQENRPLRHLVFKCRNAEWPFGPIRLRDVVPSHRRRDVSAGFDAHQDIIKIGLEVRFIIRRRHAVDAGRAILARQAIGFEHPFTVESGDAARSTPAQGVSSPDRLSIVVSWTGLRDSAFPPVFLVNGS